MATEKVSERCRGEERRGLGPRVEKGSKVNDKDETERGERAEFRSRGKVEREVDGVIKSENERKN